MKLCFWSCSRCQKITLKSDALLLLISLYLSLSLSLSHTQLPSLSLSHTHYLSLLCFISFSFTISNVLPHTLTHPHSFFLCHCLSLNILLFPFSLTLYSLLHSISYLSCCHTLLGCTYPITFFLSLYYYLYRILIYIFSFIRCLSEFLSLNSFLNILLFHFYVLSFL